jgi:predicted double-glycine peptidase
MPDMGVFRHMALAGLLALSSSALAPEAKAGSIAIESADTTFNVPVTTYKEMHFRRVVRQAYDFSCGSAALATLLTYHYGRSLAEDVVLVVLKGIRGDEVLIGDPAQGAKFMPRETFAEIWVNKIFFVIVGNTREAKKEFNRTDDWSMVAQSPLASAVARQSLQSLMLTLPSRNSF